MSRQVAKVATLKFSLTKGSVNINHKYVKDLRNKTLDHEKAIKQNICNCVKCSNTLSRHQRATQRYKMKTTHLKYIFG